MALQDKHRSRRLKILCSSKGVILAGAELSGQYLRLLATFSFSFSLPLSLRLLVYTHVVFSLCVYIYSMSMRRLLDCF